MAEHNPNKAQEFGLGDDLHAVILRTCVVTPKNKKAYTVCHSEFVLLCGIKKAQSVWHPKKTDKKI